ncbi:hypothetical protein BC332_23319 [Capsicum chinense]|nr:hypothetical protein BC332_23319 [Capsicum chinense]
MKETAKSTGIQGRIMNVSSLFYQVTYKGGIRFDKINDKNSYQEKLAYGQSKLANLLHSNELSRRLQGAATTCHVALHPSLKGVTGKFFSDCNEHKPNKLAQDEAFARKLWDFSNNTIDAALKT